MGKVITPEEAAALIADNATVAIGGFGSYCGPDELLQAVADRYAQTGHPCNLTSVTGISSGNFSKENGMGMSRLHAEGLLGTIITAHLGNAPDIAALVGENKIAGYILPFGVIMHLLRAIAGKKPGVLTSVGLGTYADPRNEGCRANEKAVKQGRQVVKLLTVDEEEFLYYPSFKIDLCIIRGTYADTSGSVSMKHEALSESQLEMAAAVHNNGGIVIVQVEDIVELNTLPAKEVHIHSSLVDYVVKASPEYHMQSYAFPRYHPELTGEERCPVSAIQPMELDLRKVIARRAAMELEPNCLINLGIGLPSGVGNVANEERIASHVTLSLESGPIGGVPVEGLGFGSSVNPEAIYGIPDTFDLYDGGVLDITFLGAAEVDQEGNVNVSKFGTSCTGPGGFINISQNTPRVYFMMAFTSGQSDITVCDGKLQIRSDGSGTKFVKKVNQITFSGKYAKKKGQEIFYITERAVFRLMPQGITLIEVAPGIDIEKDVLAHMEFRPIVAENLKEMDPRIFKACPMGLSLKCK